MSDDQTNGDELTPAERAEIERDEIIGRAELHSYLDAGWRQEGGKLVHPTDDDAWIMFDPISGEETFSARYVELLREVRGQRLAGELEEEDALTPEERAEEERKDAEFERELQGYRDRGWVRDKAIAGIHLADPDDPERFIWGNPWTRKIILSTKYAEQARKWIKAEIERDRGERAGDA